MNEVYSNSESSQQLDSYRKHTCNVCGLVSRWTDTHGYIERPIKNSWGEWISEVDFIICSDDCRCNAREPFIKWLSYYDGWTKKAAAENFDKYVAPTLL